MVREVEKDPFDMNRRGEARKGHEPKESRMTTPPPETNPGARDPCYLCAGSGTKGKRRKKTYMIVDCPACHGTGKQRG